MRKEHKYLCDSSYIHTEILKHILIYINMKVYIMSILENVKMD